MDNLPANQRPASQHLSKERGAHREWIGGRILTLLSHYWREDDPVELTAAIGADWAEVLEGIPQEYIHRACIQYLRTDKRKPSPPVIYALAKSLMPLPKIVSRPRRPDPPRPAPCDPETAARIVAELGFSPKKFGDES